MPKHLKSYLKDEWVEGKGPWAKLLDPTTEEVLAETSTTGLDFAGALDHARTVGGAALRGMSLAERGRTLQAAAAAIHERRDELIELSIKNGGNTRGRLEVRHRRRVGNARLLRQARREAW